MRRILEFFRASHARNPRVFWLDMVSTVITMAASLALAITARDPHMEWIYPGYFAGSVISIWTGTQRHSPWTVVLCTYFCVMNLVGFGRALAWW